MTNPNAWPFPRSEMTITNTEQNNVVELQTTSHTLGLDIRQMLDLPIPDYITNSWNSLTGCDTTEVKVNNGILPCPLCGSDHIAHITVPDYETPDLPSPSWIQCMSCGVEVNSKHTRKNNVTPLETWNRRR